MKNLPRFLVTAILALIVFLVTVPAANGIPILFTGDVEADFPINALFPDRNGVGDVGVPGLAPPGVTVGWDMENVGIEYDEFSDILYVGFNMGNGAISGDADGDGDPGQTAAWLATLSGTDLADLAGTESLDILIDVDQSCDLGSGVASDYEVVAGIPNSGDVSAFTVTAFSQNALDFTNPGAGYLLPASYTGSAFVTPSVTRPDFEFQIDNFCSSILPACVPGETPISFAFRARAGSAADDGIGEDAIACTDVNFAPSATAITLSEMYSKRTPLPAWTALFGLLMMVTLVVGFGRPKWPFKSQE